MAERRAIVVIWGLVALLSGVLLLGTARPLVVAWRCWLAWEGGEHAEAELVEKLESPDLLLRIRGGSQDGQACTADTSDAHHAALVPGDRLPIVYRRDRPGDCELEATLSNSVVVMAGLTGVVGVLIAVFVAAGFLAQRSLAQRAHPTTRLPGDPSRLACPGCGAAMEQGALLPMGGVHWRELGGTIGLPSTLGGLPGTVGWRARPRLHAARCTRCEVVTFRYGRPAPAR